MGREKPNLDGTIRKLRRCIDSASSVEIPAGDRNIEMLQRRICMVSYNLSDCLKNLNLRIRNSFRQRQEVSSACQRKSGQCSALQCPHELPPPEQCRLQTGVQIWFGNTKIYFMQPHKTEPNDASRGSCDSL